MSNDSATPIFLSSFKVEPPTKKYPKGRLIPRQDARQREAIQSRLKNATYGGLRRYYTESHLEAWVARQPNCLFPNQPVEALISQNCAYLAEQIDILCLVDGYVFVPVEVKIEAVSGQGRRDVAPPQLYGEQMRRYRTFTEGGVVKGYPESIRDAFERCSRRMYGEARAMPQLAPDKPPELLEVCLAEGFSPHSIWYFATGSEKDGRNLRLIEYRYFQDNSTIEFWQVFPCGDKVPPMVSPEEELSNDPDKELIEMTKEERARRAYLIGDSGDSNSVCYLAKVNLAQNRSIRYFGLTSRNYHHVSNPTDSQVADVIRNGWEIDHPAIRQGIVDDWVEHGLSQAKYCDLDVVGDPLAAAEVRTRQALLLPNQGDPKATHRLVKLNLQGEMSINVYDLLGASPDSIAQPSEAQVKEYILDGTPISHPAIPFTDAPGWVEHGKEQAKQLGWKVKPDE